VRLEGLNQLKKNPVTSSGIEPTTFLLVTLRLNHYATAYPFVRVLAFLKSGQPSMPSHVSCTGVRHTPLLLCQLKTGLRNTGRMRRSNCGSSSGRFSKFSYLVSLYTLQFSVNIRMRRRWRVENKRSQMTVRGSLR
jgi:hypothetical protein